MVQGRCLPLSCVSGPGKGSAPGPSGPGHGPGCGRWWEVASCHGSWSLSRPPCLPSAIPRAGPLQRGLQKLSDSSVLLRGRLPDNLKLAFHFSVRNTHRIAQGENYLQSPMTPKVVRTQREQCLMSENRSHCAWVPRQRLPELNEALRPPGNRKNTSHRLNVTSYLSSLRSAFSFILDLCSL